jgi:glycosyltransferase involved in cell wall biosynthesis
VGKSTVRVALDMQGAQFHWQRGIYRYSIEQLRAMLEIAPESISFVRVNPGLRVPEELFDLDVKIVRWRPGDPPPDPVPSIYHLTSSFDRFPLKHIWPAWARQGGVRTVITMYDLIPLLFAGDYLGSWSARAAYASRLGVLRAADHLLPISQVSAEDGIRCLGLDPARLSVIWGGVDPSLPRLVPDTHAARRILDAELPGVRRSYMLYVGGGDDRKNMRRLVEAYGLLDPALRAASQLVIACAIDASSAATVAEWVERAGVGEDILFTGHVTDEQLAALYRACDLFLFPSIYEGFGLPIVEAAACGAPVLASDTRSSREIVGPNAAASFDPLQPASIAAAIERVLGSDRLLAELAEAAERLPERFTWTRVAEDTFAAYERALAQPRASRIAARAALPRDLLAVARRRAATVSSEPISDSAAGAGPGLPWSRAR